MADGIGLIINPIAGMGGRVGLKGTDGADVLARALALGALPSSEARAAAALRELPRDIALFTAPGHMGEFVARENGFTPTVIGSISDGGTTPLDTERAARDLAGVPVSLLLFAGGDGTARDICRSIGESLPVLGIPAGVKIHSAVFSQTPSQAGRLVASLLLGRSRMSETRSEVMDIDEEAYRQGQLRTRLYGYMRVPCERRRTQGLKMGSTQSDAATQAAIAESVAETIVAEGDAIWLIGAGTTTFALKRRLGLAGTLLGIDAYRMGQLAGTDLNEKELLALIAANPGVTVKIILTPIGGQGFLFGRGNQQLSPEVIRSVRKEDILVLASSDKLAALQGAPLLADTGDPQLDRELACYCRVVCGYHRYSVYPLRECEWQG